MKKNKLLSSVNFFNATQRKIIIDIHKWSNRDLKVLKKIICLYKRERFLKRILRKFKRKKGEKIE